MVKAVPISRQPGRTPLSSQGGMCRGLAHTAEKHLWTPKHYPFNTDGSVSLHTMSSGWVPPMSTFSHISGLSDGGVLCPRHAHGIQGRGGEGSKPSHVHWRGCTHSFRPSSYLLGII